MIVIDTDVLLLAFAFHRDDRQATNTTFLQQVKATQPSTTIYNVLEILGKLSFNLSPNMLDDWRSWLVEPYNLTVIWPFNPAFSTSVPSFRQEIYERPFEKMRTFRMPFLDALILTLAERTPIATQFVTWNARHFQGKSTLQVLTPEDYLQVS